MSRNNDENIEKVLSSIEQTVIGTKEKILQEIGPTLQTYQRQIETYKKKAQVVDMASRYLKNGTTKVSAADKKKIGTSYSKRLDEIVAFNKKYNKAKENAKENAGLKRKNTSLERKKNSLQSRLDSQKQTYEGKLKKAEDKYQEAVFVKKKLEEVRAMPLKAYEKAMKTDDSLKQFEESTYYEGNPTAVTGVVQDVLNVIRSRDRIKDICNKYVQDVKAMIKDPNN